MFHGGRGYDHCATAAPALPPGSPASCQRRHRPSCRYEWYLSDGGDPAELLTAWLEDNGLPVRKLGRTASGFHPFGAGTPCGSSLYVSAAAGSVMAGGAYGRPSPVPGIPDVVAVLYRHADGDTPPPGHLPALPSGDAASPPADWALGPWEDSWTRQEHAHAVRQVRAAIRRGDVYQVNVVGHMSAPYTGDPGPAIQRVTKLPGARYGGILTGRDWAIATASPETLVEVRDGRVVTRPIKGTRAATAEGRRELLASAKERAEHVMIVDLERNDLSRLDGVGPVRVDELFAVRRWSGLWQAESQVSAPVEGDLGLAGLLRAVCPGGSVTGAPKLAALDVIAGLEPVGRGVSMGALGWVGTDHLDLGLTIRTAAVTGGRVHLWAGGGITWDSDPEAEVDEAAAKAGPIRSALAGSGPGQ
ncbi:chorismate-binding protein [Couchioplanes caeruleus]|uniref:Aminodeoxychorismate synthase component I n=2 Tax=Couchioplanes caeruleus TaxID=56438 RepID=A0A1K0GSM5_9ACTN|nr:chorismate-binding protein [Couchioplanes caeruleus]OJF15446.1 aminodeoxychorismate synthase component I [Couchioplanes caeruleus subsp. caeruleus]ROP27493.1 para-aminobenzoate synthetase component 1 [Couchioplanes caeruleus]